MTHIVLPDSCGRNLGNFELVHPNLDRFARFVEARALHKLTMVLRNLVTFNVSSGIILAKVLILHLGRSGWDNVRRRSMEGGGDVYEGVCLAIKEDRSMADCMCCGG